MVEVETSEKVKHILPLEMTPPLAPVLVTTEEGLRAVESFLERTSVYGFDLETNVTDTFYNRVIRTIQLGDKQEQYVIDLLAFAGEAGLAAEQGQYGKRLSPGLLRVKQLLQRHLEDASRTKVGQGLQFESEMMLWNFGIRVKGYYDTLLAEKNIYAGLVHFMTKGFWGLEDLVLRYTGLTMSKDEQKNFDLTTPLTQNQVDYCGLDVRLPMAVRNGQLRILEKDELMWAAQIEFDAIPAFADMHLSGIYLDPDPWREIINERLMMRSLVISAMDAKLLPVVGAKYVTEAELERRDVLEKQWRDCPNKTAEDRAQRAELRKAFMVLRKSIAERVKEKDSCIGEAAINYSSPAQIRDAFWQLGYTKKEFPKTDDRTLEKLAKYPNLAIEKAFTNPASLIGEMLTSKYVAYMATLPIVDLLRLFRSIEKSITTYGHTWIITQDETWGKKKSRGVVSPFTGRIHSDINQFGAATGRTSSRDPNCFSPDTEVLTETGWCRFDILSEGVKLAQYDTATGSICFAAPEAYVRNFVDGKLVHNYTDEQVDLLTTADHECLLKTRNDVWVKETAAAYAEDRKQYCAGEYLGGAEEVSESRLICIAALQADGHLVKQGGISWCFKKERKYIRLKKALEDAQVPFTDTSNARRYQLYVGKYEIPRWLSGKKRFGAWILGLSKRSFAFLAEEVWKWDGCVALRSMYASSEKNNADWVQILTALSGRRARIRAYDNGNPNAKLSYQVDASNRDYSWTTNRHKDVVPYKGHVYCVSMPLGTVIVRRNNVVAITGQCQNIPKGSKYRHCFKARPGYKLLTVDYSGCELRILAELSGEKVWLDAFKNGWDVHSVGAEIMFGQRWKDGAADGCKYVSGHLKCKCPVHEDLRNKIKAINFGIAYGMMAKKLGDELGIPEAEAQKLLDLYYAAFPTVIAYLEKSGANARNQLQQRTICGRRRRWNKPTWDSAKKLVLLDAEAERKKPADQQDSRKLNCTDRSVSWKLRTLAGNIEREGKNSPIQGANADVAKIAMALIWPGLFPRFRAFFVNMVHDELVIECPEENAKECFKFVSEKMEEAGRQMLKLIPMTTEGNIEDYWSK